MNATQLKLRTQCNLLTSLNAAYLPAFGDVLATRQGYRKHRELDAIYFYLVEKYRWPPAQARALSHDDLLFLLEEEMADWHPPRELLAAVDDALAECRASERRAATPSVAASTNQVRLPSKPPKKSRQLDVPGVGDR